MKNEVYLSEETRKLIKDKKVDKEKLIKKMRLNDPTWVMDLFGVKYNEKKIKNV